MRQAKTKKRWGFSRDSPVACGFAIFPIPQISCFQNCYGNTAFWSRTYEKRLLFFKVKISFFFNILLVLKFNRNVKKRSLWLWKSLVSSKSVFYEMQKNNQKSIFLLKSGKVTILLFFTLPQYSNLTGMWTKVRLRLWKSSILPILVVIEIHAKN